MSTKKDLEAIKKEVDRLAISIRDMNMYAFRVNVRIGTNIFTNPFSGAYGPDVYIDLQTLIEKIMEHFKLDARMTEPTKSTLVVEKKKDTNAKP